MRKRAHLEPSGNVRRSGRDSPLFVGSLEKGLRVFTAFGKANGSLRLTEIAAATGLDKSAAQRFTHTLHELGYLRKDEKTKHYSLALKVLELGFSYLYTDALVERATPYLLEANTRSEETVNLTELDGTDIVYVARIPSRHALNVDVILGTRLPAYCTAAGRAILAHLPETRSRAIIAESNRIAYTAHTITDAEALWARIARVKEDGYAVVAEEYTPPEISVAAPILDFAGQPVAAVNIAVTTNRWTVAKARRELASIVMETTKAISRAEGSRQTLPRVPRPKPAGMQGGD